MVWRWTCSAVWPTSRSVARPPSNSYRVWKTWKRNKVLFGAGFVVALALVLATGVSTWQAARATRSRNAAESLLYVANMNLMGQAWAANDPGRVRQLLEQTAGFPGRGFEWYYWQRQVHQEVLTFCKIDPDESGPPTFPGRPAGGHGE